jgi:hypothetical protein
MTNKHIGSSFDDFLNEEGLLAEAQAVAVARVFAWELEAYIVKEKQSKTAIARSLETSRSAVDRILDPENTSINLTTMAKLAEVMGKRLEIRLA